jgi:NADPH-dependent glutamate synthase beta subunit-like oxidoreductase
MSVSESRRAMEFPSELADDTGDTHFVPAPCQVACPVGTDAPSYLAYIWEEKFEEAFEAITATNPFSSICGRVCDAPCEPACRRADSDGPIAIRNLKRFVMDQLGQDVHLPPVPVSRKETVGVVGGGPAGLTAAHDLAVAGYEVHVYEMSDRLGGMMIWGIPAFRCPPEIIEEDMQRILKRCPGIKVHLNTALGTDVSLDELKQRHDAVLLTIGAWWGKKMEVPGEDDDRVIDGVSFLRRVNGGERPEMPETVVVIGGGDVSMDACRVSKRLPGCKDVKVLYRRGRDEIPARKDELHGAIEEGIEIVYNTQQTSVEPRGNSLVLKCIQTTGGEIDVDGRKVPVTIPGTEHEIVCDMVIAAVGQQAESDELSALGLMNGDRVRTEFDTMRTDERNVFAAGDGAFGGSTIVMAMHHGQKVAYYIKAFLEGARQPLPYRTPYRTRRVPVSQDPAWEIVNRQEQAFHGLGKTPITFPEIESAYELDTAKAEAARCYRCDAENGTAEYTVRNREDIFAMARTAPGDTERQRALLRKRLSLREDPYGEQHPPTLDDIVFLPANLSRLVIDPYREACVTETKFRNTLAMNYPLLVTGFDEAPDEVRKGLAAGMAASGCGYIGMCAPGGGVPWLQLVPADGEPDEAADVVIHLVGNTHRDVPTQRARDGQLLGIAFARPALEQTIPYALEHDFDLLLLDGTGGLGQPWSELHSSLDFTVLRDSVALMRRLNQEEAMDLAFFGGVRSGTDTAKLLAQGINATVVGAAMGFAIGGQIGPDGIAFASDYATEDRKLGAENFLKACSSEVSMMARATGKTNVHNLEPEDLRAISVATAEATGIILAGTH